VLWNITTEKEQSNLVLKNDLSGIWLKKTVPEQLTDEREVLRLQAVRLAFDHIKIFSDCEQYWVD
jgi:hypothetical protein